MSSPTQPIVNWRDKIVDVRNKIANFGKAPLKPDTSWHDEMVRKATDTFTKPSTMKVAGNSKTATKKKLATKERATKRVASK
jgi:hypothetical protein